MAVFKDEEGNEVQAFTQDELDKILADRLAKAKEKFEEEKKKLDETKPNHDDTDFEKELEKRLLKRMAELEDKAKTKLLIETEIKKRSMELGVPESLLKAETLEEIEEKAKALEEVVVKVRKKPEINRQTKPKNDGGLPIL